MGWFNEFYSSFLKMEFKEQAEALKFVNQRLHRMISMRTIDIIHGIVAQAY